MTPIVFKYPFDPEAALEGNKVYGEAHTVGTRLGRLFAPDYGPFFGNGVTIVDADTGKELRKDQYALAHNYVEATRRTGQAVYAAVVIKDPDLGTNFLFDGHYVGGEFSYSYYAIKDAIEAIANDDRPIKWGDLIGLPAAWNPAPHLHSIYETYDWKTMIWAIEDVANAIREGDVASRQLLVEQMEDKLNEFDAFLREQIAAIRKELNYVIVIKDTVLEINRRYLVLGDYKLTMPSITGEVQNGNWVMLATRLGAKPYIVSNDKSIRCVNGTDSTHQGVLLNDVYDRMAVWNGPAQTWEI